MSIISFKAKYRLISCYRHLRKQRRLNLVSDENNNFSIIIPGRWRKPNYLDDDIIGSLNGLLKLKSENNIELHVKEVRKRGNEKKIVLKNILVRFGYF